MSSTLRPLPGHGALYQWHEGLDRLAYVDVCYLVTSHLDGMGTAHAMAMEQSAAITCIAGYFGPDALDDSTVRIRAVEAVEDATSSELVSFDLPDDATAEPRNWRIHLAIPRSLLPLKPTQLLNGVVGDIPRFGFLTRFRLESLALPGDAGPGPAFGVAGLRARLGVARGPLLCRPQRPAVGIDWETMARLNHDALAGGCHLVKDCELQAFACNAGYRTYLQTMLAARDAASQASGERKCYIATLVCEPHELAERWDIACTLGVDGVLVAPALQGLGTMAELAAQRRLPILCHSSGTELMTRHPGWGIAATVMSDIHVAYGADLLVSPSDFAVQGIACDWQVPLRAMPILQGGKHPGGLGAYRNAVGNDDYVLNVATWLDTHPNGLQRAAGIFREAVDAQAR